jgi:hypothetical protein
MEQERLASRGNGRTLDHFEQGDQGQEMMSSDQVVEDGRSEGVGGTGRTRLDDEWRVEQIGEGIGDTRCLILEDQGDRKVGEVTNDRTSRIIRSSPEIDRQ